VKLTNVVVFASAYRTVAQAARENYPQIVGGVANASQRLGTFSTRRPCRFQEPSCGWADGGS
jgi:hypothetical protein